MKWLTQLFGCLVLALVQTSAFAAATTTLPESRILLFDDYALTNAPNPVWRHEGPLAGGFGNGPKALLPGTNHFHRSGWVLWACRAGNSGALTGARIIPPIVTIPAYPLIASNLAANLQNTLDARIESPTFTNGIGTVYFETINSLVAFPTQITIEIATNMLSVADETVIGTVTPPSTNGLEYIWESLNVLDLNAATTNDFTRYSRLLNYRQSIKLRIRRSGTVYVGTSLDANFTVIDNIRVSAPPSDVVVYKTECPFEPGYPSVNSNITIRCFVSNVDTNVPTDSRVVKAWYRWRYLDQASNSWASIAMKRVGVGDNKGNNERYETTNKIAYAQAGDLEYYFTCDFDGYRYQSLDYTKTGLNGYPYVTEWLSPRTLRGGADGSREFYSRLRPFVSKYGTVSVVTDQLPQPIQMELVGNEQWRGMVPIRQTALTNLSWYFTGANAYTQGADTYSTNRLYWTEQAQAGVGRVPYGGVCVPTNETSRIRVSVNGGGYVQMVFNTSSNKLDYMTSRTEYQNFNAWPAPSEKFSDTGGQNPRHSYLNTFDAWPGNTDQTFKEYFVAYVTTTNVYSRDPFYTPQAWVAGSAAYAADRGEADYNNKPTGVLGFRNLALRLKGGDGSLGLGYVYNTVATRPDGLKQVSFKCRLGQSASNFDVTFNRNEFTKTNYLVRANAVALSGMSPEQPSISLIGYYRDPGNFYEFRITQIPNTADLNNDRRISYQLFKWVNGSPVLLKANYPGADILLTTEYTVEMRMFNSNSSSTRIRCKFGAADDVIDYTDGSAPYKSGTYGFLSADCRAGFSLVYTQPTTTEAIATGTATLVLPSSGVAFDTQKLNWYTPAGRFEALNNVSPYGIYSIIPTQKIGVYSQLSDYNSTAEAAGSGSPLWQKLQEVTVPNFGYTAVTVPVYGWQAQFVMLQVMGGTADVAVDELAVSSWHGKQSSDSGQAKTTDWVASEAWVLATGTTGASGTAGLYEGKLSGAFNTTAPNPNTKITLSTVYANLTGWEAETTYIYSGLIYLDGSTYMFGENSDDSVLLNINGLAILNDGVWDRTTTATYTPPAAGWYSFELRVGNGVGGAGPANGGIGGSGLGVAYSKDNGATWRRIEDPGNGTFLSTQGASMLNVVHLDHSRGNPDIDQAIRSMVLDNGMGQMEFDYRVTRGPAKLTVQYAPKRDSSAWVDVQSFANNSTTAWAHASAYVGRPEPGYLRVLNYRGPGYTNALVEIDNAIVWDEPYVTNTSWKVYNAKVSSTDQMRILLDQTAGCFLNNSTTLETEPTPQDQYVPYLQSPVLPAGLGEVTFLARAYTNNQSATVYVYATTNGWSAPTNQWFKIAQISNISNMFYQTYSFKMGDKNKYDAIRLETATSGWTRRVCLEEVAVSEPIFPNFDIVNVKVLCEDGDGTYSTTRYQPLISDDVGIEAQMSNIQLAPSNIQMYVTYYVGTNVWGVDNWPAGQTVTKPMFKTPANPLIYRTSPTNDIPVQELDQVVQYRVWASYMGGIPLTTQQETFENPSWYYPTDLNQSFAGQGWSPYYIVYGVPLGAIWINEVNATDYVISNGVRVSGIWDNQYIEIAVPAGVDLAGWKVDLVTTEGYATRTIQIPAGLPAQESYTNGYAFFVIGEHPAFRPTDVPPLPKLDYGFPGLSDWIPQVNPGGLRLRRPLGMYEHVIAYDWNPDPQYGASFSGTNWAAKDPEGKFVYVGREYSGGSLNVTNGTGVTLNDWCFPLEWTPGGVNVGQLVQRADVIMPGISNVWINSSMNSANATQNGKRTTYYSLKMRVGQSTNIAYVADDWYRIYSVKKNLVEQLAPSSALTSYMLNLPNLSTNTEVAVTIGLRQDVAGLTEDPAVLDWLLGFGDAPLVPSLYNGRELTLNELYWLNADPTKTNRLDFMVMKFNFDAVSNAHATVKLVLNGLNVTNLQGESVMKIEAKQALATPAWNFLAQYALSTASFDTNHISRFTIEQPFRILPIGWGPGNIYLRGLIENQDPRWEIQPLVTEP